jgi:hypothetical protein
VTITLRPMTDVDVEPAARVQVASFRELSEPREEGR